MEKNEVEEVTESTGQFVDTQLVMKSIPRQIPDDRLLEIAEQSNAKHMRIIELNREIKNYSTGRKSQIKELTEEVEEIDEQFAQKTEMVSSEVQKIADFETGKVRYVNPENGELLLEEEMNPGDNQREFAAIMDEAGQDLVEQATKAIDGALDGLEESDDVLNAVSLASVVAEKLTITEELSGRLVVLLREKGVVRGRGYPGFPFVVVDVEAEAAAEKEQSEELEGDQIKEAIEAVIELQRASTSALQRKLKIGYNRTARLMDELEVRGVIGPVVENQARDVMFEDLEAYEASREATKPESEEEAEQA